MSYKLSTTSEKEKRAFAERVKEAMAHGGITSQADACKKFKINSGMLSKWMNGQVDPQHIKAGWVYRFTRGCGVSARWLVLGPSEAPMRAAKRLTDHEEEAASIAKSLISIGDERGWDAWRRQGQDLVKILDVKPNASNPFPQSVARPRKLVGTST